MKTKLPEKSKEHGVTIYKIRDIILERHQEKIGFIILFGSFARGDWVYDSYVEDHINYEFASDYDFLILTKKNKNGSGHQANRLIEEMGKKLKLFRQPYKKHTPTIIVESVDRVNKELEKGQYFFSDIKKEGICLYDSDEFELAEAKELTNQERKIIAEDHFNQWFESALGFLRDSKSTSEIKDYKKSAFYLHQATEHFISCALLVLTDYKPKSHDLGVLLGLCASQSSKFLNIFPMANQEQKDSFELLRKAYIDARYNKDYKITKEQLEYLIEKTEKLKEITKQVCEERINSLK